MTEEIPPERTVEELLQETADHMGEELHSIEALYKQTLLDVATLDFPSDTDRTMYAIRSLRSKIRASPVATPQVVVPVGFSVTRRPNKGGSLYSEVFALFPELDTDRVIRLITVYHDTEVWKGLQYHNPHKYLVALLPNRVDEYKILDARSVWHDEGVCLTADRQPVDPLNFIKKIQLDELADNLSEMKGDWPNKTDWKCLVGNVVEARSGINPETDKEWAWFNVGHSAEAQMSDIVEREAMGEFIHIWCPPLFLPTVSDEVEVYGTISEWKGEYRMSAHMIRSRYSKLGIS